MTNTESRTKSEAFAELVEWDLASAERAYAKVRDELTAKVTAEGFMDFAYMLAWNGRDMVWAQFRLHALTVAGDSGEEAFADVLGSALAVSGSSTSGFSNAVDAAKREAASSLLAMYRSYLSEAAMAVFASRFC